MTFKLNNKSGCRPVLGCLIVLFICGIFSLFIGIYFGVGALFVSQFRATSSLTDGVNRIVQEDPQLADVFGTPIELRLVGTEYSSSMDGNVTTATYQAPISGPLDSGRLFAEIKQVGDDVDIISLRIELESGETIQVIPKE